MVNENIISRKPPKSPTSSPSHSGKTSPHNGSCTKVLFDNNNSNDSSAILPTKRSPIRTGIMSRLTKHSHNNNNNNKRIIAPLPIESTNSPTEHINISKSQVNFHSLRS